MGLPTTGYDGIVKSGTDIADFIGSWTCETSREQKKRGPYIGDGGATYVITGAREGKLTLKGEFRSGASAFRRKMMLAEKNNTNIPLTLEATNAVKFDAANVKVVSVKIEVKGEDGADVEFEVVPNGDFDLDDANADGSYGTP